MAYFIDSWFTSQGWWFSSSLSGCQRVTGCPHLFVNVAGGIFWVKKKLNGPQFPQPHYWRVCQLETLLQFEHKNETSGLILVANHLSLLDMFDQRIRISDTHVFRKILNLVRCFSNVHVHLLGTIQFYLLWAGFLHWSLFYILIHNPRQTLSVGTVVHYRVYRVYVGSISHYRNRNHPIQLYIYMWSIQYKAIPRCRSAKMQSAHQGQDGIGAAGSPVVARWTDDGQLRPGPGWALNV